MESTTSPRPAVSVKISKDGIAWLLTTIEETSLGVFKIVSEEVTIRFGQSITNHQNTFVVKIMSFTKIIVINDTVRA